MVSELVTLAARQTVAGDRPELLPDEGNQGQPLELKYTLAARETFVGEMI